MGGGASIFTVSLLNLILAFIYVHAPLLYTFTSLLCVSCNFSSSTVSSNCVSTDSPLLTSHLFLLAGDGGEHRSGVAADLRSFDQRGGAQSPRETGGSRRGHAHGIGPAPGGQRVGNMVPDLPKHMFHLMGFWPEGRVEDPGALMRERRREGG